MRKLAWLRFRRLTRGATGDLGLQPLSAAGRSSCKALRQPAQQVKRLSLQQRPLVRGSLIGMLARVEKGP